MSLGLSHSLSRHKLKFSPEKVDIMVMQAVALLDELDKELNTYAMRVKEWYGWHFPELGKILNDNLAYARVILTMGMRTSAAKADLSDILPEEIETAVKAAAEVSMGTEITDDDLSNIKALAEQVVGFTEYRQQLSSYLTARMTAIAPNLTALVGELVGARLIAHAGSLMNLAKSPASTIQILGAEKALFRALKTKHDTPKYGLIYHASLVGQATGKNKGKIARVLAAKAAIGLRVDALADWGIGGEGDGEDVPDEVKAALGHENRLKIERRVATLEGKPLRSRGVAIGPNGNALGQPSKWEVKEARKYNKDADGLMGNEPAQKLIEEVADATMADINQSGEDSDEEMADAAKLPTRPAKTSVSLPAKTANGTARTTSPTLSSVSEDSVDVPVENPQWQSSIEGNTKEAKKARKKERHARNLAKAEEKSEKKAAQLERRKDRSGRRLKKEEQRKRRAESDVAPAQASIKIEQKELPAKIESAPAPDSEETMAAKAGLSLDRYRRKMERGEIKFEADGKPVSISKKDIKKAMKADKKAEKKARTAADEETPSKKRKQEEDGGKEKKKKKKSKAE